MQFDEIPSFALPSDAIYFFNILIICVSLSSYSFLLDKDIETYWDISGLLKPRPYAFYFYKSNDLNETREERIELYTNTVVEVRPLEVSWFATKDTKIIDLG